MATRQQATGVRMSYSGGMLNGHIGIQDNRPIDSDTEDENEVVEDEQIDQSQPEDSLASNAVDGSQSVDESQSVSEVGTKGRRGSVAPRTAKNRFSLPNFASIAIITSGCHFTSIISEDEIILNDLQLNYIYFES